MTKATRALSGAAKNAYLDKVVRSALGEDHAARERLARELAKAVASLRVRLDAPLDAPSKDPGPRVSGPAQTEAKTDEGAGFDPFTPNVVVVLRTKGREAALAELRAIREVRQLRLLAHEQQLGIPEEARTAAAIAEAIVVSAERRIANRRAAGR